MMLKVGRILFDPSLVTFNIIEQQSQAQVLSDLREALPQVVWNAAALEGNACAFSDVEAFFVGRRPDHISTFDAEQVLALISGYNLMIEAVESDTFTLSKAFSDRVHSVIAKNEAIESGHFRGEGAVTGGGTVRLATGGTVAGDPAGAGGAQLRADYDALVQDLEQLEDPRAKAFSYIASATRSQFYFDGNKRTSRIMGTGVLLAAGYPAVNIPKASHSELDIVLDELFRTDNATPFIQFLTRCTI